MEGMKQTANNFYTQNNLQDLNVMGSLSKENIETINYNQGDSIAFDGKESEKILFYDSLVEVSELVKRLYTEQKMFRIISVELICIGNCEDKKSKKSKETAIKELNEIIQKYDIKNKYY